MAPNSFPCVMHSKIAAWLTILYWCKLRESSAKYGDKMKMAFPPPEVNMNRTKADSAIEWTKCKTWRTTHMPTRTHEHTQSIMNKWLHAIWCYNNWETCKNHQYLNSVVAKTLTRTHTHTHIVGLEWQSRWNVVSFEYFCDITSENCWNSWKRPVENVLTIFL